MDALSQYIAENEPVFVYDQKAELVRRRIEEDLRNVVRAHRSYSAYASAYMGLSPVTTGDYRAIQVTVRGDNLDEIELVSWWGKRRASVKFTVEGLDRAVDCSKYAYGEFCDIQAHRLMMSWTATPAGVIDEPSVNDILNMRILRMHEELTDIIFLAESDMKKDELTVRESLGSQSSALAQRVTE